MIKDKVRKEICLLFVLILMLSLLSSQSVSASSIKAADSDMEIRTETAADDLYDNVPEIGDLSADIPADAESTAAPYAEDSFTDTDSSTIPSVTEQVPAVNVTSVHLLAGGNSYELHIANAVHTSFVLSEGGSSIVGLSEETAQSVTIRPISAGRTVLLITAVGNDSKETVLSCQITVSSLSLSTENIDIYMNDEEPSEDVSIQGVDPDTVYYESGDTWKDETIRDAMNSGSQCSIRAGNPKIADAWFSDGNIHIRGISKGITNIKMSIYGVPLSIRVIVHHYTLNKYTINTYQGSGIKNLKLKGAGSHKVIWVSGNTNVASVSKTGIVSIRGVGTTKITAKVNGRKVVCIVSVSSKTAYRVVKDARALSKQKNIQYSQMLRMSKNYYDCSSLVYRCYRPYGIRFGYTNPSWAPTAADEAYWCSATGHVTAMQAIDLLSCKLVPGDTIYYSFNGNNGRYLNIDHTAIFAGYGYDASMGYYGTVIEASSSSNTVTERMYYASDSIQMIGRPSKK